MLAAAAESRDGICADGYPAGGEIRRRKLKEVGEERGERGERGEEEEKEN